MKTHLVISLISIICGSLVCGQDFDKVATYHFGNGSHELNKTDELGRKQGLWVHYKMYLNALCSGLATQKADTCLFELSKGNYINDKKVGTWEFYDDGGCYFLTEKTVTYNDDGSVVENNLMNSTKTEYSPDSSLVVSTIETEISGIGENKDTIIIKCFDKANCVAQYHGKEFREFNYEIFDVEQYLISGGEYNRTIRSLK